MLPISTALRASRTARIHSTRITRAVRFASQNTNTPPASASGAITGGLVGGGVALGVTYAWYHFSGAKSTLQTAKQAKGYLDQATNSLKVKFDEKTPDDTNEAIKTLRDAANKYAGFVPGGKGYVDAAFSDLEMIRKHHGHEADNVVREAYSELRDMSKKGMNLETANEAYDILSKHLQRLLELSKDAAEDIMQNHPQLKEKLGGSAEQLKQLGERVGPEAKKEIDDAWQQVNDIINAGLSGQAVEQARKLLQDKMQKVRQIGDKAFDQAYQQLQPMLEKNPKVKEVVEQNLQTLKEGNISETMQKVSTAVANGSTQDLESYLQQ